MFLASDFVFCFVRVVLPIFFFMDAVIYSHGKRNY